LAFDPFVFKLLVIKTLSWATQPFHI
jgi:hypothetical protein